MILQRNFLSKIVSADFTSSVQQMFRAISPCSLNGFWWIQDHWKAMDELFSLLVRTCYNNIANSSYFVAMLPKYYNRSHVKFGRHEARDKIITHSKPPRCANNHFALVSTVYFLSITPLGLTESIHFLAWICFVHAARSSFTDSARSWFDFCCQSLYRFWACSRSHQGPWQCFSGIKSSTESRYHE